MSGPRIDVRIGGLTIRVDQYGTKEQTLALVESISARMKELEAASGKVNTQAFALQAAYEFAFELAQFREDVRRTDSDIVKAVGEITRRVDAFRAEVEASAQT